MTDHPDLIAAVRGIALAPPGSLAKLQAIRAAAVSLAVQVRHGIIEKRDVVDRLRDEAIACGVVGDVGEDTVIIAISEGLQFTNGHGDPFRANGAAKAKPSWRDSAVMARELCDKRFPTVKYIVPGLFPEGVVLLVSRPKRGKSWLLQQVGSAVARGVSTLVSSEEPPVQGDVLYLNLEDGERRAQRRMTKHFGSRREAWPERLTLAFKWKRLEEGGLDDLRGWCKSVSKPTLIMIDTLKRVRVPKKKNCTDYDADYEACQGLLDLSHEFPGLVIIAACHDRKMEADDIFDTVSGTLGLTGGVDTVAIIKRGAQGTTLHIQGRDLVDDVEKAVSFDRETCLWSILGEAAEVHRSGVRAAVLEALGAAPAEGLGVKAIMEEASISSRGAADQLLGRMVKDGVIERRSPGKYSLPGASASDPASDASESQKRTRTH